MSPHGPWRGAQGGSLADCRVRGRSWKTLWAIRGVLARQYLRVHEAPKIERIVHALRGPQNSLVGHAGLTVTRSACLHDYGFRMPGRTIEQPKSGFALEIDGRLKTEFSTKEGAEHGAIELKRRFPMLQIRIYYAATQSRHDLPVQLRQY